MCVCACGLCLARLWVVGTNTADGPQVLVIDGSQDMEDVAAVLEVSRREEGVAALLGAAEEGCARQCCPPGMRRRAVDSCHARRLADLELDLRPWQDMGLAADSDSEEEEGEQEEGAPQRKRSRGGAHAQRATAVQGDEPGSDGGESGEDDGEGLDDLMTAIRAALGDDDSSDEEEEEEPENSSAQQAPGDDQPDFDSTLPSSPFFFRRLLAQGGGLLLPARPPRRRPRGSGSDEDEGAETAFNLDIPLGRGPMGWTGMVRTRLGREGRDERSSKAIADALRGAACGGKPRAGRGGAKARV
jgi:hypothetical protein